MRDLTFVVLTCIALTMSGYGAASAISRFDSQANTLFSYYKCVGRETVRLEIKCDRRKCGRVGPPCRERCYAEIPQQAEAFCQELYR